MTRGRSGQSCGRGLAWSMISACQRSVQQNADDPGSRFEAAREFKSRRPHQTWPNLVRDEQDFWKSGFEDRKSTRLNSSHITISYAVFCLKKKKKKKKKLKKYKITN